MVFLVTQKGIDNMQEIKNITMIGKVSENLKQTDDKVVCYLIGNTAFGKYHGISIREHYIPFKTKKEAIESANKYYNDWAKEFPDNTKPFGLVLYMKGHGWLSMSSNLLDNELEIKQKMSNTKIKEMWLEFGDIPMNPNTEEIEQEWNGFPIGTHREEIWHWFEEQFSISVVDLMF